MAYLNVVLSDRGWILEKMGNTLASQLSYVRVGPTPDKHADLQCYITYAARSRRVSPVEVAWFTHLEPHGDARRKFFEVAQSVEYSIVQNQFYATLLRDTGVTDLTVIPPGVDLESFKPRIRIGVVGRTYHTGRKGEHLIAQMMDIPEIEWLFTGDGWPEAGLHLSDSDMPDFYRKLDYVLVPSLYEGGPMSVIEALACGTEVIAPPIGWIPAFPHHEFRVGDADDLRRLLLSLVEKKRDLRKTVLDQTWDRFAEAHDDVFRRLAHKHGLILTPPTRSPGEPGSAKIALFVHGGEARSLGGPSVRVPRLAQELNDSGWDAVVSQHPDRALRDCDIVHAFNVWPHVTAVDLVRRAKAAGKRVVLSPIFLDLSLLSLWQHELPRIFDQADSQAALEDGLEGFLQAYNAARTSLERRPEPVHGFHAAVREMVAASDHVIFLSDAERTRLARIGARAYHGTIVKNPVDSTVFANADPADARRAFGVSDFVLCVARQEPRKNQLMLIQALKGLGIPLVLIGHAPSDPYRKLIARYAGPDVHIVGRLPAQSPLLASAFAAARVTVLPSWAEGAPLAALEAAASGANLVLSNESGEIEYFGSMARYADPASVASLRETILGAFETPRPRDEIDAQKSFIAQEHDWSRHRERTAEIYRMVSEAPAATVQADPLPPRSPGEGTAVMDVTTTAHHKGRWTGISRVEHQLSLALMNIPRLRSLRFVAWNRRLAAFIEVPAEVVASGHVSPFVEHHEPLPSGSVICSAGATLLVFGSAWMQNASYVESLVAFKREHDLRLVPMICDIIPVLYPFWFEANYAPTFTHNLKILLTNADAILAISHATRNDIQEFTDGEINLPIPDIAVIRLGDALPGLEPRHALLKLPKDFQLAGFVLAVGAIHRRKNYDLLYDVWIELQERMGPRCPLLVIVGGIAWGGNDLARALRNDKRIKETVLILEDVADDELCWLYENCLFTVYPSLYEGWGLPVAESLRHGKICLASDASSIGEIAPSLVEMLDPSDRKTWLAKIIFYAMSQPARRRRESEIQATYQGCDWSQSGEDIVEALALSRSWAAPRQLYTLGQILSLSDRMQAARIKAGGWHLSERWGSYSSSLRAELMLELPSPSDFPLKLIAEVRSIAAPSNSSVVDVLVNGEFVASWWLDRENVQVRTAIVPASSVAGCRSIRLTFVNRTLVRPGSANGSRDERQLGLGLSRLVLCAATAGGDPWRYLGLPDRDQRLIQLGKTTRLAVKGKPAACLDGAWKTHAAWGAYPAAGRARLLLLVDHPGDVDLTMECHLRCVASHAQTSKLMVLVNDTRCGSWEFSDDQVHHVCLTIPAKIRHLLEPMKIEFLGSDLRSPRALGIGDLDELFPFGLISIRARASDSPSEYCFPLVTGERFPVALINPALSDGVMAGPWHELEKGGVWSFGAQARLALRMPTELSGDVLLLAEIGSLAAKDGPVQARVEADGRLLGMIEIPSDNPQDVAIAVPAELRDLDSTVTIDLVGPAASSPRQHGAGTDDRLLGFRLRALAVRTAPPLLRDRVALFGTGMCTSAKAFDANMYARGPWHAAERNGRWISGSGASIAMFADPYLAGRGRLFVLARVIGAHADLPITISISSTGKKIGRCLFHNNELILSEVEDFAQVSADISETILDFRTDAPRSPNSLGMGDDRRELAVMIRAIVLVAEQEGFEQASALLRDAGLEFAETQQRSPSEASLETPSVCIRDPMVRSAQIGVWAGEPWHDAQQLEAGRSRTPADYLGAGWYPPEKQGRWSHAGGGELALGLAVKESIPEGDASGTVEVQLFIRVYGAGANGSATVDLLAAERVIASFRLLSDAPHRVTFRLNAEDSQTRARTLTLRRLAAVSPRAAGEGRDNRALGVFLSGGSIRGVESNSAENR